MKVLVVLNPRSGTAASKGDVLEAFDRHGVKCQVMMLDGSEGARTQIELAATRCDVVAAAGGDGTISSVADILASSKGNAALGIIPAGTCNDLSRTLQIPCDIEGAVNVIAEGETVPMDLIRTENERFIINQANGGFAGAMAKEREKGPHKGVKGIDRWRSYPDVIRGMPVFSLGLKLDGQELEVRALSLTVANARYAGGGVPTAPDASCSDGLMDIVIIEEQDKLSLLKLLPQVASGRYIESEGVIFRRARRLDLASSPEMPFSLDGEERDEHETFFEIAPGQIPLRMPADTDGG